MSAQTIAAELKTLLTLLSDRQPHRSAFLRERLGYMCSATFNSRLNELRRQGHDVRKVTDRRDYKRKAHVVEYQLF